MLGTAIAVTTSTYLSAWWLLLQCLDAAIRGEQQLHHSLGSCCLLMQRQPAVTGTCLHGREHHPGQQASLQLCCLRQYNLVFSVICVCYVSCTCHVSSADGPLAEVLYIAVAGEARQLYGTQVVSHGAGLLLHSMCVWNGGTASRFSIGLMMQLTWIVGCQKQSQRRRTGSCPGSVSSIAPQMRWSHCTWTAPPIADS